MEKKASVEGEASTRLASDCPIQPVLARIPQVVTLGELMAHYTNTGATWGGAFGRVETPANFRAPTLAGMRIVSRSDPGTSEGRYVGMGIHESNSGFNEKRYGEVGDDFLPNCIQHNLTNLTGLRRVFFIVSQATAQVNKLTEAQHLSDHQVAYDLTLGLAEKILTLLEGQGKVPRMGTPPAQEVVTLFQQAMRTLKVPARVLPFATMGLNMAQWLAKYQELINRSQERDNRGWHTWELKYHDATTSNEHDGLPIRFIGATKAQGGDPPVYLEVVQSPTYNLAPTFESILP